MNNKQMSRVHRLIHVLVLVLLTATAGTAIADDGSSTLRIGMVIDGVNSRESNFASLFRAEMVTVAGGARTVEFPEDAVVDGGWDRGRIASATDELLARGDLDVIVAMGVGAGAEICKRQEIGTPVVVPFAFGGCSTECPDQPDLRVRTLDLGEIVTRDLRAFDEMTPFTRVAVLIDELWPRDCSGATVAQQVTPEGVVVDFVAVEAANLEVVDSLPPGTDAVYIMPLLQLDDDDFDRVVRSLTAAGLPSFSMIGESEVAGGVLAGMNTRATMVAFVRGAALDVLDLLEGRAGSTMAPADLGGQLTLNMATAQALGFSPSWELLTRARLLHDEGFRRDRSIDLATAIQRAVAANLDLAVKDRRVAAGAEDVREARSAYRPRVDLGLSGVAVDEDHAMSALGQYAVYAAGSLTLTQLIYSDGASANIDVQKDLQHMRELDRQALGLDIARETVAAYMGVMRSDALIQVRREQVDLTRTNLELARLRRSLGAAGAAEVHRWEAELATARAGLLEAMSTHRSSERQLSRLLNEPLTTRWDARQPDVDSALGVLGGPDDAALLDTRDGYDRLASSLVVECLERSPELAALEAAIAAQDRAYSAARRTSYVPTVALKAGLSRILAKDETGGIDLGDFADLIPELDDTSWNVAVQAELPVVSGGANKARRIKAQEELFALRADARSAREKLEQRTLWALDTATASWSTISLRRQAADAAARTQELVRDAYARGAASILDLLDAQNNALNAELAALTSVYDFLDDWAEVQRAVAGLDVTRPSLP